MERLITHNIIQTYLTRLNELLIISNTSGETGLSKISEELFGELFSIVYKVRFENTNLQISNFPAIDLHNEETGIAIQITANRSLSKIYHTYDKFFKNGLHKKYNRLIIVILSTEEHNLKTINTKYEAIQHKYNAKFTPTFNDDIINLQKIYRLFTSNLEINNVNKIRKVLEASFEKIKSEGDLVGYNENLKSMFFEVIMDDEAGLTLNSIYVEPSFDIIKESANKDSTNLKHLDQNSFQLINDLSIHDVLNSRLRSYDTFDGLFQFPKSRVTFVLGYPGQGKTSLCSKLLFDLITTPLKKPIFYLKLRNISDTKAFIHSPFNVIFDELETEIDAEIKKSQLKNSIVILDGLDELYMKDNLTSDDIEIFCKSIIHETDKFKDWHVLITTRHGYIDFDRMYKEGYVAISLKALDTKRQKQWLTKYLDFHPESWLDFDYLDSSKSKITTRGYIGELINQPLLLYIVASLKAAPNENTNRGEIYNLLFNQIIERKYSKDGQIENLKALSIEDLRRMVQEVALMIFKSGKGFVNTKDLLKNEIIKDFLENVSDNKLSTTLKGIMISFYFKEYKENNQDENNAGIEFFHKSLQEYLTAEIIVAETFGHFTNKDQSGKYINKKDNLNLAFLNEYFGSVIIPYEIWDFIEDLIIKKLNQGHNDFRERLEVHLKYFFHKDFILQISGDQFHPIEYGLNTFSCYWKMLQLMNNGKNYVTDREIARKLLIFHQLTSTLQRSYLMNIQLSYQHLVDQRIDSMVIFDEYMRETNFSNAMISSLKFYDSLLEKVVFIGGDIFDIEFNDTNINDVKFKQCDIYSISISSNILKRLIFDECTIENINHIDIKKSHRITFRKCEFSPKAFNHLKSATGIFKLDKCYIRDYSKKNTTTKENFLDTPILELI